MKITVPTTFDLDSFHEFCHALAREWPLSPPLTRHDVGQHIKGLIVQELPTEYVRITRYEGWDRFRAGGKHRFLRPVPRQVMLDAVSKAGFEIEE